MTAVGPIQVQRTSCTGAACQQGEFDADRILGLDGSLTPDAAGMTCLAGVPPSFAHAEHLLDELAGWQLDDETIRRVCHQTAQHAQAERQQRATATRFAEAPGDHELHSDAGKVNTFDG